MKPASLVVLTVTAISLAAWSVVRAATPEPQRPPRLAAYGNDHVLWVLRGDTSVEGLHTVRSAYRLAEPRVAATYGAGQTVVGDVSRAAARDVSLHVFFQDGTHRRFAPRAAGALAPTSPRVFTEVNLPGAVVPLGLAGDAASDVLYAVVPRDVAVRVADEVRTRNTSSDGITSSVDVPPDGVVEPASNVPPAITFESPVGLVRYSEGQWFADREGPSELRDDAIVAALVAHEATLHLLYRAEAENDTLRYQSSGPGEDGVPGPWTKPTFLPLQAGQTLITGFPGGDGVAVVLNDAGQPGVSLQVRRLVDSDWVLGTVLEDETFASDVPPAAAVFDGHLAVARLTDADNVEVRLWSLQSGEPTEPAHLIPQLIGASSTLSPWIRQLVQYSLLTLILVVVFVWRRECVTFTAPLPPEQDFARLSRRGLAFLIDLSITALVWAPGVYRLWRSVAPGLTPSEQLSAPTGTSSEVLFWSWALVGFVIAVYGAIFELALGATAGKRIAGCFVVDEMGRRCRPGPVVIRNLARVVEFHFPALVLLIVFTPSRQRLGDVLARTVVAEKKPPEAEQPREPDHTHHDDTAT